MPSETTSTSTEFLVNTATISTLPFSVTTTLADGGFVIAWHSTHVEGQSLDVLAQLYHKNGSKNGEEFQVNTHTPIFQHHPNITALKDGGFVVVWESVAQNWHGSTEDQGNYDYNIFAQRYTSDGTKYGFETQVNDIGNSGSISPDISSLEDGGYVISWVTSKGVFARKVEQDQLQISNPPQSLGFEDDLGFDEVSLDEVSLDLGLGEFLVYTYPSSGFINNSAITSLNDGGYIVSWDVNNSSTGEYKIYTQRYTSDGTKVGSETLVTETNELQLLSSVTSLDDGGYIIVSWVWPKPQYETIFDIFTHRYDSGGNKIGSETLVTNEAIAKNTSITSLNDGGYVISWEGKNSMDLDGIYAQRFDVNGIKTGAQTLVNTTTIGEQRDPSVTSLSDGGYVVSWDAKGEGDNLGIYAQRFDADGNKIQQISNIAPVANEDITQTDEDVNLESIDVLKNDDHAPGTTLKISSFGLVDETQGKLTKNADETLKFVPTADFNGQVNIKYTNNDGSKDSNETILAIAVNQVNDNPNGEVKISAFDIREGRDLTASNDLTDIDGMGDITYTWNDGTKDLSTGMTYTLTANDIDKAIKVKASYKDKDGNDEIISSTGTKSVLGATENPDKYKVVEGQQEYTKTNDSGYISQDIKNGLVEISQYDNHGIKQEIFKHILNNTEGALNMSKTPAQITTLKDGGLLSVHTVKPYSDTIKVIANIYNTDGTVRESNINASDNITVTNTYTFKTSVTGLSDGGFVISWAEKSATNASNYQIFANRFNADGSEYGNGKFVVAGLYDDQDYPSITALDDGGYTIVWTGKTYYPTIGDYSYGVYGRTYSEDNSAIGNIFKIYGGVTYEQAVATLNDGSLVVTWINLNNEEGYCTKAIRINSDGTQKDNVTSSAKPFEVSSSNPDLTSANRHSPVTALNDGGYVISWTSVREGVYGVYTQRYNSNDIKVGGEIKIASDTNSNTYLESNLDALNDGGYIVSWGNKMLRVEGNGSDNHAPVANNRIIKVNNASELESINVIDFASDNENNVLELNKVEIVGEGQQGTVDKNLDNTIKLALNKSGEYKLKYSLTDGDMESNDAYIRVLLHENTEEVISQTKAETGGYGSDVAPLANGGYIVTWNEIDYDLTNSYSVLQKIYNKDGSVMKESSSIIGDYSSLSRLYQNKVLELNDGSYLMASSRYQYKNTDNKFENLLYKFNEDGTEVNFSQYINTTTKWAQYYPSLISLDNGTIVAVWQSEHQDGDGYGVYMQRYDQDLNQLGYETKVNTIYYGDQKDPSVTALNDGDFVVTWQSEHQDGSGNGIYMQVYGSNGYKKGVETPVTQFTHQEQIDPSVSKMSDGGFIITWTSDVQDESGQGVFAQRFDSNGVKIGNEYQINTTTYSHQNTSHIIGFEDGGYLVAWQTYTTTSDETSIDIVTQQFNDKNEKVGVETRVNAYTKGHQYIQSLDKLADESYVITYRTDKILTALENSTETQLVIVRFERDGTTFDPSNSLPTGDVTITGLAKEGETLTASNELADEDGMGEITYTWTDGITDLGTGSTFTLTANEVGKAIQVKASYIDDGNTPEQVKSDTTTAVTAKPPVSDGHIVGTGSDDDIVSTIGANLIEAKEGSDTITLVADATWTSDYLAKNIHTGQKVSLEGKSKFSDVTDGGIGIDTINLTTQSDAFFLEDIYSELHKDVVKSETQQNIDSAARLTNVETIKGGAGDNIIDLTSVNYQLTSDSAGLTVFTQSGNDIIWGSNLNDHLYAGEGNDIIFGGAGSDTMIGMAGIDTFQFTSKSGTDTIGDFMMTEDKIEIYYQNNEGNTFESLSLNNNKLTWAVDAETNVQINLQGSSLPTTIEQLDSLVTFIEI